MPWAVMQCHLASLLGLSSSPDVVSPWRNWVSFHSRPRPSEAQIDKERRFFMSIPPERAEHQGFALVLGQMLFRRGTLLCAWLLPSCMSPKHPHLTNKGLYFCRVCFPSLQSHGHSFFQIFLHIQVLLLYQSSVTTPSHDTKLMSALCFISAPL